MKILIASLILCAQFAAANSLENGAANLATLIQAAPAADSREAYKAGVEFYKTSGDASGLTWLKDYHVIFVPGFFSDKQINLGSWVYSWMDIFSEQKKLVNELGISNEVLIYDQDRVANNAKVLSNAILASAKPVILISHSHGSQVALEALMINGKFSQTNATTMKPLTAAALKALCDKNGIEACMPSESDDTAEIKSKVKGFVSINGNILGTPLAEYLFDDTVLWKEWAIQWWLAVRPDELSVNIFEMSQSVSSAMIKENRAQILQITSEIPTISIGTWYIPGDEDSYTDEMSKALAAKGISLSDGIVPTMNSIIPGSQAIVIDSLSHFDTVKYGLSTTAGFDIKSSTQATLHLLGQRIAPAPPLKPKNGLLDFLGPF